MMAITHAAITSLSFANASAGTSLVLGTASPLTIGFAVLGSQLPDIDTTTLTVGKICYPVSSWIEDRFPHRSITFPKQSVQLFYSNPAWAISVSNPRWRLKTGGTGELWVLAIA